MSNQYRELPPPDDLSSWVRCRWTSTYAGDGATRWVVPDGCLDLMWLGGEVVVAGPDDGPNPFRPDPSSPVVTGVRFRPGRAAPVLREAADRLRNQRVALADLGTPALDQLGERLTEAEHHGAAAVLDLLVAEVRRRVAGAAEPDAVATGAADLLMATSGRLTMGRVAGELSVSERHLRRRATEALGYGPKTFARIVRFQHALALLGDGRALAEVASGAGYTDQAHLTREVVELSGRTPGAIARDP